MLKNTTLTKRAQKRQSGNRNLPRQSSAPQSKPKLSLGKKGSVGPRRNNNRSVTNMPYSYGAKLVRTS